MSIPTLAELRAQIDALDADILAKLSARARCAQQVGESKRAEGSTQVAYYRPERERQVLERVAALNAGPLPDQEVMRLFREIMSACLALELPLEIAYLGPEGTFTQAAALKQFGHSVRTRPMRSIGDVFKAVESGACNYGVVPVENSTEGMVTHTLDSFATSPLSICGEVLLRIGQNLLTHAATLKDIRRVYSHSQSLAQCRGWLAENLPDAETITVSSNAEAAKLAAAEADAAAIAGKMAAERYGVPLRYPHIEDDGNNTTRFLVLGKQDTAPSGRDKTSLLFSIPNRAGAAAALLAPFGAAGISMTKFESRPSKTGLWEYVFFIDIEGHRSDTPVRALLERFAADNVFVKTIGSYPAAVL